MTLQTLCLAELQTISGGRKILPPIPFPPRWDHWPIRPPRVTLPPLPPPSFILPGIER
jgi:hypothetical protein